MNFHLPPGALFCGAIVNPEELLKVVDQASKAGDRWLFIAVLMILLAFAGAVIKWLVEHINAKDKRIEEKDKLHDEKLKQREQTAREERSDERSKFIEVIDGFKKEISAQAVQLRSLADVMVAHDKDMRDAHRIETSAMVHSELLRLGINAAQLKQMIPGIG